MNSSSVFECFSDVNELLDLQCEKIHQLHHIYKATKMVFESNIAKDFTEDTIGELSSPLRHKISSRLPSDVTSLEMAESERLDHLFEYAEGLMCHTIIGIHPTYDEDEMDEEGNYWFHKVVLNPYEGENEIYGHVFIEDHGGYVMVREELERDSDINEWEDSIAYREYRAESMKEAIQWSVASLNINHDDIPWFAYE